jgi:hypothetical protein
MTRPALDQLIRGMIGRDADCARRPKPSPARTTRDVAMGVRQCQAPLPDDDAQADLNIESLWREVVACPVAVSAPTRDLEILRIDAAPVAAFPCDERSRTSSARARPRTPSRPLRRRPYPNDRVLLAASATSAPATVQARMHNPATPSGTVTEPRGTRTNASSGLPWRRRSVSRGCLDL